MSRSTERALILGLVKTLWKPEYGAISWPNIEFQTPNDQPWAAVRLVDLDTNRLTLGRDYLKRTFSSLQIDFYTPRNDGTDESRKACDYFEEVLDMMELKTTDGERVVFDTPTSRDLSSPRDGTDDNWHRRVLDAVFYRDTHVQK